MDLTEMGGWLDAAINNANTAQSLIDGYLLPAVRNAYHTAQRTTEIAGQLAGHQPMYNANVIRSLAAEIAELTTTMWAQMEETNTSAHRAMLAIENAIANVTPVVAQNVRQAELGLSGLEAALEILGGYAEIDDIGPIYGETASIKLGQAINTLNEVRGMLR